MQTEKNSDNWATLLSELGLEAPADDSNPTETPAAGEAKVEEKSPSSESTPEPDDATPEKLPAEESPSSDSPQKRSREGKKTFFERFPKINLFGASSKETLDAVVEGAKMPSLSGSSFTAKTLEKVPERTPRPEPSQPSAAGDSTPPERGTPAKEPPVKKTPPREKAGEKRADEPTAVSNDPWSQIASQVGSLSEPEKEHSASRRSAGNDPPSPEKRDSGQSDGRGRGRNRNERSQSRKPLPSLFDEEASPESEEAVALKRLIESTDHDDAREAAERLDSLFDNGDAADERPRPDRARNRGRRGGRRQRDAEADQAETASTPDVPAEEPAGEPEGGRRRRGSRYAERKETPEPERNRDETRFAEEEYEGSTWDIEEESQPVERRSRGSRQRGRRMELKNKEGEGRDVEDSSDEYASTSPTHKNIPSWDDAVAFIIEANKERQAQRSAEPRRKRR